MASENAHKAEVLGSYFSAVFTKENKISYDTRFITADAKFTQLTCQFSKETILDKLSQLNIYKSPGPDSFHPRVFYELKV